MTRRTGKRRWPRQALLYQTGQAVKYLYKRGKQAFEIDATVVGIDPLEIAFLDPGSKKLPGGVTHHRVLWTARHRQRLRALRPGESPSPFPDPEQALRDAIWQGEIDGMTTSEIARRYDLDRQRANRVLARIMEGKSSDPRFGKPNGSTFRDKHALISRGRILTREPVEGPYGEYRWQIVNLEATKVLEQFPAREG